MWPYRPLIWGWDRDDFGYQCEGSFDGGVECRTGGSQHCIYFGSVAKRAVYLYFLVLRGRAVTPIQPLIR